MGRPWQWVRTDTEQSEKSILSSTANAASLNIPRALKKYYYIIKIVFKDSETTASTYEL